MTKSPSTSPVKWTLAIKVTPTQGQPATRESDHNSEREARITFGATYKILGTDHRRIEAWIDPPEGPHRRIQLLE